MSLSDEHLFTLHYFFVCAETRSTVCVSWCSLREVRVCFIWTLQRGPPRPPQNRPTTSLQVCTSTTGPTSAVLTQCKPMCHMSFSAAYKTPAETRPPPLSLESAGQVTPEEGRDHWNRKTKTSPSMVLCRDDLSSDTTSRLQQEKQMLLDDVRAQKVINH